jgi:hypothetical protein
MCFRSENQYSSCGSYYGIVKKKGGNLGERKPGILESLRTPGNARETEILTDPKTGIGLSKNPSRKTQKGES